MNEKARILGVCQDTDPVKAKSCWEKIVKDATKKGDIDTALTTLAGMYDANHAFGETCHSLTHDIGQAAYLLFARNNLFKVSPKTAYCSYGFYHGFMEALVREKGDMTLARKFCDYADKQLAAVTPDATLQCYHGIGHGTVNNHDPRTWGNEQTMIDPAIALCEHVSQNESQLSRCLTGVFNGIATFYLTGEYKLSVDTNDPFKICRLQKRQYQDACYISLNITVLGVSGGEFAKAARFVEAISDDTIAGHAIINLASPIGSKNMNNTDHTANISVCRSLQPRLRQMCIAGYAFGFFEQGQPEREYIKPIAFCSLSGLTIDEQTACLDYIFTYLKQWYSQDKARTICSAVADSYKSLCFDRIKL